MAIHATTMSQSVEMAPYDSVIAAALQKQDKQQNSYDSVGSVNNNNKRRENHLATGSSNNRSSVYYDMRSNNNGGAQAVSGK
mgnify:CR=1 FL=1